MKTTLFKNAFIIALALGSNVRAQTLPNANFETWNSTQFSEPNSWTTSNMESVKKANTITTTSVTGFSGIAVHMQTKIVGIDTLKGYIYYGPPSGDPISGKGGLPYTQKPANITGYYRYNLPGNDTALMYVAFKKNGQVLNHDWIKIRGTGTQSTFTSFSYSLSAPSLTTTPDSVIIAMASSNAVNNVGVQNNSYLEVDQLAFTGAGITQTITNGSFENWNTVSIDNLAQWGSTGDGVSKVGPGYSGAFAVELKTMLYPGNFIGQSGITNGYYTQNGPPKGGQPYSQTTDTLYGYYKFSGSTDSGVVFVNLSKLHSPVGGAMKYLKAQNNWTLFKMPIFAGTAPDTMRLEIYSSQPGNNVPSAVGSKLTIDNLYLYSQPVSIKKNNLLYTNFVVYPNPAKDILTIDLNSGKNFNVNMFDVTGKKVNINPVSASLQQLKYNIADLNQGVYFIKFENEEGSAYYRFIKD